MTARTWIVGKSNNQVTDPSNFSPMSAPEPGDDLTITSGTMNISGRQLPASDVLNVGGDATVNIRNGVEDHLTVGGTAHVNLTNSVSATIYNGPGNISINTTGTNHLDLFTPGRGVNGSVHIQNSGTLIGRLGGFSSNYTLDGGRFYNIESSAGFDGQTEIINADVIGRGLFHMGSFHAPFGKLEFMKSVGSQQTVSMEGGLSGYSVMQIDHPEAFKAAVNWATHNSVIDLNGLAADSYSYHDGVLDFFHGNTVTDTLRFNTVGSAGPFSVAQGTSTGGVGVEIYSSGTFQNASVPHGANLPLHT